MVFIFFKKLCDMEGKMDEFEFNSDFFDWKFPQNLQIGEKISTVESV